MSLFWRVLLVNAALLVGSAVVLAASPLTVSDPIGFVEALILVAGLTVALAADYVLLRRVFGPLEQLTTRMQGVDLLRPGGRLAARGGREIAQLERSFNDMLERLEAERRDSGRRALEAQEGERSRVAKDLHDEVGQSMTGVLLQLERLSQDVPARLRPPLLRTQDEVRRSLDEVRRIARELRPELLEHLGLVSALRALSRGLAERNAGTPAGR
jgi:two-component system sensor histidine kinase UhpB